jgi:hypothetical protein
MSAAVAAIFMMQAFSADPPTPPGGPLIGIAFAFREPPPSLAVEGMESELSRLLADSDIQLQWIERKKGNSIYVNGRILVLDIVGNCQLTEFGPQPTGHALAWNDLTDGQFQPFITVDCNRLGRFIAREVRGNEPDVRRRLLGRAIARVVAHEMYHFFTRTRNHSSTSTLFRSALPADVLVEEDVNFKPQEIEKLEHGVAAPIDCDN